MMRAFLCYAHKEAFFVLFYGYVYESWPAIA